MGNAVRIPHPQSPSDLEAMPEKPKAELVEGVIVCQASPSAKHGELQIKLGIIAGIASENEVKRGGKGWRILAEAGVLYDNSNIFQHDLAGWRRETCAKLPPKGPIPFRPDWVCEILSTNRSHDTIKKMRVLHKYGVPYYWVVDPMREEIEIRKHATEGYLILDCIAFEQATAFLPPFEGEMTVNFQLEYSE